MRPSRALLLPVLIGTVAVGCASVAGDTTGKEPTCVAYEGRNVCFVEVDGNAIVEGDIVIGTVAEMKAGTAPTAGVVKPLGFSQPGAKIWPGRRVPYLIESGFQPEGEAEIRRAIAHWESSAGFKFEELVKKTADNDIPETEGTLVDGVADLVLPDHLSFHPSETSCSSHVGQKGGSQTVTLVTGGGDCGVHEIGHALGLLHEQNRPDRDKYIEIHWENVQEDAKFNFDLVQGKLNTPYDIGSIMQYESTAFSKNGKLTITRKGSPEPLPRTSALSAGDIAGINVLYAGQ